VVARPATERGSQIVHSGWRTVAASDPSAKTHPGDWVTEVDLASEAAIAEVLAELTVSDWDGGSGWMSGDILAGSAAVHAELLEVTGTSS
jgi:fructose-1,6-bisphosphatase/inositol monophosphatase family enzyme